MSSIYILHHIIYIKSYIIRFDTIQAVKEFFIQLIDKYKIYRYEIFYRHFLLIIHLLFHYFLISFFLFFISYLQEEFHYIENDNIHM